MSAVGVVVIGRNEAANLVSAIRSAQASSPHVVYVDSGSADESCEIAASAGVDVVELDPSRPFTAARAYNAGVASLQRRVPGLAFVQFLDGDARLDPQWVEQALQQMQADETVAVVCGRRRETMPDQSLFSLLADVEWDTPVGDLDECGPESLMRMSMFDLVGGFDETMIAGEEPEICFRLRQAGGRVRRIAADASTHDIGISGFRQWWQRSRRGGYAFAHEAWLHRHHPGRYRYRQCLRAWWWGLAAPGLIVGCAVRFGRRHLLAWPLLAGLHAAKTAYVVRRDRGYSPPVALQYGLACYAIKFPELAGQLEFVVLKLRGRSRGLLEYR